MNGEVCCILGVCCPPGSEEQARALATELTTDGICNDDQARKVATWTLKHFDLAPKGTATPLLRAGADLARKKDQGV